MRFRKAKGRGELQLGALVMSPQSETGHQRAVERLATLLNAALPADVEALPECEVVLTSRTPATVRVPDIGVTVFELDESGQNYQDLAPAAGTLAVQQPFPMSIELTSLTGPRI